MSYTIRANHNVTVTNAVGQKSPQLSMRLQRVSPGNYQTPDGRYWVDLVEHDDYDRARGAGSDYWMWVDSEDRDIHGIGDTKWSVVHDLCVYLLNIGEGKRKNPQRLQSDEPYMLGKLRFRLGGIGTTSNLRQWAYRGFATTMRPSTYLKLAYAADLYSDQHLFAPSDARVGETRMASMRRAMAEGRAFAPATMSFSRQSSSPQWRVTGHEGRHRMESIRALVGDNPVPVVIELYDRQSTRASHITDATIEQVNAGAYSQDGPFIRGPLFGPLALVNGREVPLDDSADADTEELLALLGEPVRNPGKRSLADRLPAARSLGLDVVDLDTRHGVSRTLLLLDSSCQSVGTITLFKRHEPRRIVDYEGEVREAVCYDGWQVTSSAIAPEYTGQGIGVLLYSLALYECGAVYADRAMVSDSAARVWQRLFEREAEYVWREFDNIFDPVTVPSIDDCKIVEPGTKPLNGAFSLTKAAREELRPIIEAMQERAEDQCSLSGDAVREASDTLFSSVYY